MVTLSKKDARKVTKIDGKGVAGPSKSKLTSTKVVKAVVTLPAAISEPEGGDDESEWSSENEDEENGGVSEKGMKRLMELVGEEDLDDFELARLDELASEDEDEDGAEDEDDEAGELDDEVESEAEDGEKDSGSGSDEEEAEDDDEDELVEAADPDAIRLDDVDSDASLDDDMVPMRKITANNKPAMRTLTEAVRVTHLPWPEHLVMTSKEVIDVDPSDDLKREMAFYKVALDQVSVARKLASKHDIPFSRPNDYYAEMVKSDEHMERVRTKLVDEAQGIKKSEEAKRQRDLKKYGKQIQMEKIKQREMDKKSFQDRVQGVKRKRKEGAELGEEDFDIQVDHDMDERPSRGGAVGGRGRGGKPKIPRHARDAKYSLGGGGKRSKQNTKESTNDFTGWGGGGSSRGGSSRGGGGGRGGRGGGRGGGGGGGGGGGRGGSKRLGKSRRK